MRQKRVMPEVRIGDLFETKDGRVRKVLLVQEFDKPLPPEEEPSGHELPEQVKPRRTKRDTAVVYSTGHAVRECLLRTFKEWAFNWARRRRSVGS